MPGLSSLQKYILLKIAELGGKVERGKFRLFYDTHEQHPKEKHIEKIITQSIERLIDRELLTGFGRRTPHKWFITHVQLTRHGHLTVEEILHRRQQKLPFGRRH